MIAIAMALFSATSCATAGTGAGVDAAGAGTGTGANPTPSDCVLVWHDEFDGGTADLSNWRPDQGERGHATNVPEAVTVADGFLTVATYSDGGQILTGMVRSKYRAAFGYWEARIRFVAASGTHGAFWLQVDTVGREIGDPQDSGVETDIVEHRELGEGEYIADGLQTALHWDGYGASHKSVRKVTRNLGLSTDFHVYGLRWSPRTYRFYVDGSEVWRRDTPISHVPQYVVLSREVIGGWWSGPVLQSYGTRSQPLARMDVDYVRHYSIASDTSDATLIADPDANVNLSLPCPVLK